MSWIKFIILIWTCICLSSTSLLCPKTPPLKFYLVRKCQRASADDALALENTPTLNECINLALQLRGMALNYAPIDKLRKVFNISQLQKDARSHLTVWQQPGDFFNCHILQCPQNLSFSQMINDSRFDYFSLYGRPPALDRYTCVPQVGLFSVYPAPSSYLNASRVCSDSSEFSGSLAHIVSTARTMALSHLMVNFNQPSSTVKDIFLAYVGLKYNNSVSVNSYDFRTAQNESLLCFLHRAWDIGHPSFGVNDSSSCVALTPQGVWQTLNCDRPLPFICEIHMPSGRAPSLEVDIGPNSATQCNRYEVEAN
ncbi:uncharacterized protein [Drosophila tropicalis]|uniref:uncharacterized protein n=1 Tax=Drosophila tropicalis TaxID=46794 RepID=UPI0035ABA05E